MVSVSIISREKFREYPDGIYLPTISELGGYGVSSCIFSFGLVTTACAIFISIIVTFLVSHHMWHTTSTRTKTILITWWAKIYILFYFVTGCSTVIALGLLS